MTNGKRRKVFSGLLALCLLLIAFVGWQMLYSLRQQTAVTYGPVLLTANPPAVCAGEGFTYDVTITVLQPNSVSRITEGWCREDGICPRTLQNEPYYVNFVLPYGVNAVAKRTVPDTLTPGRWQLRHCNETHATGKIDVICYQVEIEVLECLD